MIDILLTSLHYIIPFIVVLSILVFVHEFGHFYVARVNGVKVDAFSIGFGPELFAFTDKKGTRWRFAIIPVGGYVKMFGDDDAASATQKSLKHMTPAQRKVAFPAKTVKQRAAIVAAGPAANYLLGVLIFAVIFSVWGVSFSTPVVGEVLAKSAAFEAGLQAGDKITQIDNRKVERFEDIQQHMFLNVGEPIQLTFIRENKEQSLNITPTVREYQDNFGNIRYMPMLGIRSQGIEVKEVSVQEAFWRAVGKVYSITADTLQALGQIIMGTRGTEDLGGPIKIAQLSKDMADGGIYSLLRFIAILSVNLGLINLFPVPVLDGGHLVFYGMEAVRGRPLDARAQNIGAMIGLGLIVLLMVFVTWNDLMQMGAFSFLG